MDGWIIALYGTNENKTIGEKSQVNLSDLDTTDPMTDDKWLKLEIIGGSPVYKGLSDKKTRIGGITVHRGASKRAFTLQLYPIKFPDEMYILEDLNDILNHRHIFFFKGTYDFEGINIHPEGKAIEVAINVPTPEDDFESGTKEVSLDVDVKKG